MSNQLNYRVAALVCCCRDTCSSKGMIQPVLPDASVLLGGAADGAAVMPGLTCFEDAFPQLLRSAAGVNCFA